MSKKAQLAKISRPRLHDIVVRKRLFALIDAGRANPVIWIAGPPGSGKTALVSSYLETLSAPFIWYQVDGGDADPASFFHYLSLAVCTIRKRARAALPVVEPEHRVDLPGFASRFIRAASSIMRSEWLLVLDNYQQFPPEGGMHDAICAIAAEMPPQSTLIVISREPPPRPFARLVVGQMGRLGWDDLRLHQDETRTIVAQTAGTDTVQADRIHDMAAGWAAGVRLLVSDAHTASDATPMASLGDYVPAFDYFATEVLRSVSLDTRRVLLATAFPTSITASMAESLSGDAKAGEHLEQLYRQRLFVERRVGRETVYQYHDLFRAFLQHTALQSMGSVAAENLIAHSAVLLCAAEMHEEAFSLFVRVQRWHEAEAVLLAQARVLIGRGLWHTVQTWTKSLPESRVLANPWLGYWLALSHAATEPTLALTGLATAYDAFSERGDLKGCVLCGAAIIETLHFVVKAWNTMGQWVARLQADLARLRMPLCVDDELRANVALFWGAENSSFPASAMIKTWVARSIELLPQASDLSLRVSVANILHYHSNRRLDEAANRAASVEGRRLLDSQAISPDRRALYFLAEGMAHRHFGRHTEAIACFDSADELIHENGLQARRFLAGTWRAICLCEMQQYKQADAIIKDIEPLQPPRVSVLTQVFEHARACIAFGDGNVVTALEHSRLALDTASEAGPHAGLAQLLPKHAYFLIASNRLDDARVALDAVAAEPALIAQQHMEGSIHILHAWCALASADMETFLARTERALNLARDRHQRLRMRWYPKALEAVLPVALRRELDADTIGLLVAENNLIGNPEYPQAWPWPVRILSLGRFEVQVHGKRLEYGRKPPRRTVALLKALVAMGKDVSEERLVDLLWPELEADAGMESLAAALHRLRRLLGMNEAIRHQDNMLGLDTRYCYVDAWEFDRLGETQCERALGLYKGQLLDGDRDAAWTAPMRERLRAKFIRVIESAARNDEQAGDYRAAIKRYQQGLETDDLVEPFYQGLMRCHARLDQRAEIARSFHALQKTLSVNLGVPPSTESDRLFRALSATPKSG